MGAAGLSLAASPLITSCSIGGSGKRASLALIGCGKRGMQLLEALSGLDADFQISYVCDVDSGRAQKAVEMVEKLFAYTPAFTQDMKEVFEDETTNAVLIATPGHWNTLAALWACQAGKDVFLEATPGVSVGEGQKMIEAADKSKSSIQVGFQHRSAGYCSSAREYIAGGSLGEVLHVKVYNLVGEEKGPLLPDSYVPEGLDWDRWLGPAPYRPYNAGIHSDAGAEGWSKYWDFSEGRLACTASQLLDMARMIMGDPKAPRSAYSSGGNWSDSADQEVPQMQTITYDYESFTLTCETGCLTPYMVESGQPSGSDGHTFPDWQRRANRIEVYGTLGLMYLGLDGDGWQVLGGNGEILASEAGDNPDPSHLKNFLDGRGSAKLLNAPVLQGVQSALLVHMGNTSFRTGSSQLLFDSEKGQFIDHPEANVLINRVYRKGFDLPDLA